MPVAPTAEPKNTPKTKGVSVFVKFGSKTNLFPSDYLDAESSETRKRPDPMKALGAYSLFTSYSQKAIKGSPFTKWAFQRTLAAYAST